MVVCFLLIIQQIDSFPTLRAASVESKWFPPVSVTLFLNKPTHPLYGILLILLSSLLFATHDNISKYLTLLYPPVLVVWARFMTQSVLMVGIFAPRMGFDLIRSKQIKLQLARGACMMIASLFFVLSLHFNVPVGEATAVVFLSP